MASIGRYRNGWRAQVYVDGHRQSKTFKTKGQATQWAKAREGALRASGGKSVSELLNRYGKTRPAESTRIENLDRRLGHLALSTLTRSDITQWRDDRLESVSASTVRREMNTLRSALRLAVDEWGWLESDPSATVKRPSDGPGRQRRITQEEIDGMIWAGGYRADLALVTISQRVVAAFLFALETAMRCGEICQAQPEHKVGRVLHIPKTKNGYPRDVPLSTRAVEIWDQVGGDFNLTTRQVDSNFRRIRIKAGLSGFTFHDSRHEAISRLAMKLEPMPLARMTGHRDLKMLMRYFHTTAADDAMKLD